jgi:hypothetical protein
MYVLKARNIKLCTPRTNNVNNPPLLLLNENGDYDASFFVEEEDNCPGYVKLLLAEEKTNCAFLGLCRRISDDKWYLSSSNIKHSLYQKPVNSLIKFDRLSPPCHKRETNGPAHTVYKGDANGHITSLILLQRPKKAQLVFSSASNSLTYPGQLSSSSTKKDAS